MSTILKNPRYTIIHILLWTILFATIGTQLYFRFGFIPKDFYIRTSILIGVFYLNYVFLVPKLLLNKKIILYIAVSSIIILLFIFIFEPLIPRPRTRPLLSRIPNPTGLGLDFEKNKKSIGFIKPFHSSFSLLLFIALSTSVRLVSGWYKTEKQRTQVESQKINSELLFLKAQLNPHFLFNTLNSIYSLANKKSDNTTIAIVTLSELMRYMIYEANANFVPLKKEIDHIQNYIALQLLRLKDSSGVRVNVHGNLNYKIEPLLLISFIENAFKYGTDFKGKTNILIKISIENKALNLYVYNTSSPTKSKNKNSGIGLENIKNRLNLLYPNSHTLNIANNKKSYEVNLVIKLKNVDE
ncbi:sensor histidine kinase [Flavivirga jejuensis]|uniref:Sensor histidine kinase n=1 Tax=Flavivirga jejuensis TaxID=870487 RepID=A0ABT8WL85_9FLAO|nr:sensor histidine kinase [Flavivirga jejuensis]MDO5973749.1 sensor histidine kinase [Flavivirga jejuensis]